MCRDPVADRMVNGEVLEFSALPFDTVRRLKAKLAAQTGVPAHQQRLLLNTEILRDRMGEICVEPNRVEAMWRRRHSCRNKCVAMNMKTETWDADGKGIEAIWRPRHWKIAKWMKTTLDQQYWVVVSNIFYFHPYLGRWSNLTNIFQPGWNHQLEYIFHSLLGIVWFLNCLRVT